MRNLGSRTDAIIVLLAALLVGASYVVLWTPADPAHRALIHTADGALEPIDLDHDRTLPISGPLGTSHLEIHAGRMRFAGSPCPNQACVHTGWLSQVGDFAACLPNRVSVTLVNDRPAFDALNF